MKIENLNNCTGCSACKDVCAKTAILMKCNESGFLYPEIDAEKCIKCGKCEKVCPAINPLDNKKSKSITIKGTSAFAAINKNESVRLDSSSGGIFFALAEQIIAEGGVVFGAKFTDDFSVIHSWTDSLDGLTEFQGSKYLQSIIGNSYKDCKNLLEHGRKVLFSGTPCQIHGLIKYLESECNFYKSNPDYLFTVDFICHGVPSPLLWQKYIEFREKKSASRTVKTAFRRKNDGWKQYSLLFTFANNSEYCQPLTKDPYMQIFLKDVALRKSCYECPCRGIERSSDITLADFWGIQNILPEMDDDKGTSFVICHSNKGDVLLSTLKNNCSLKEVKLEDGARYNSAITKSPLKPNKREAFYKDLESLTFESIIRKYAVTPIYIQISKFLYRCIRKAKKIILGDIK